MSVPPARKKSLLGRLQSLPLRFWVAFLVVETIVLVACLVVFLIALAR